MSIGTPIISGGIIHRQNKPAASGRATALGTQRPAPPALKSLGDPLISRGSAAPAEFHSGPAVPALSGGFLRAAPGLNVISMLAIHIPIMSADTPSNLRATFVTSRGN
jgi:hypothetical protein